MNIAVIIPIFFAAISFAFYGQAMEDQKPSTTNLGTPVEEEAYITPSLKELYAPQIISSIAHEKMTLDNLDALPQELAQKLVNTPFRKHNDTLAHFYAQKAAYLQRKDPIKALAFLNKLATLFSKGFNNLNSHDDLPLTHSLVACGHETTKECALQLLKAAIERGACINAIGKYPTDLKYRNILEAAVYNEFFEAVKYLTENTTTSIDLNHPGFPHRSIIISIAAYSSKSPLYRYLDEHTEIYKKRNEGKEPQQCCSDGGHQLYSTNTLKYGSLF